MSTSGVFTAFALFCPPLPPPSTHPPNRPWGWKGSWCRRILGKQYLKNMSLFAVISFDFLAFSETPKTSNKSVWELGPEEVCVCFSSCMWFWEHTEGLFQALMPGMSVCRLSLSYLPLAQNYLGEIFIWKKNCLGVFKSFIKWTETDKHSFPLLCVIGVSELCWRCQTLSEAENLQFLLLICRAKMGHSSAKVTELAQWAKEISYSCQAKISPPPLWWLTQTFDPL